MAYQDYSNPALPLPPMPGQLPSGSAAAPAGAFSSAEVKKGICHPSELRNLLRYDPDTGKLFWRRRDRCGFPTDTAMKSWNARFAGREALHTLSVEGYLYGKIWNRHYKAHRVAWAIHSGNWPDSQIDHINGDRADNRFKNLRDVSHLGNMRNKCLQRNSASGVTGVRWHKRDKLWIAQISVHGKCHHLGMFKQKQDAVAARKAAEHKFGFHKNHGRKKNTAASCAVSEGANLCPPMREAPSHPYPFPPNGSGQNAADRIANAMWEIEK